MENEIILETEKIKSIIAVFEELIASKSDTYIKINNAINVDELKSYLINSIIRKEMGEIPVITCEGGMQPKPIDPTTIIIPNIF